MTMKQYNEATKILKEKELLEEKLYQLRQSVDFMYSNEYVEICNKLFELGQNFSAL